MISIARSAKNNSHSPLPFTMVSHGKPVSGQFAAGALSKVTRVAVVHDDLCRLLRMQIAAGPLH